MIIVIAQIIILIVSFIALIKGADVFVNGSSGIAKKLKIPSLIIGLTIVAFGTSAPELSVSVIASINRQTDIAVANVVGSNIFNILGVLGISAIFAPLVTNKSVIKKEFPFMLLSGIALFVLSFDRLFGGDIDTLSTGDGVILLLFFAIFLYSLLMFAKTEDSEESKETEDTNPISIKKSTLFIILGLGLIILGGKLVVSSASSIALQIGMSENLIGLTVIAVGTSLPELVTSITAARKGERDIAVGNVVGSNIFNILFILGVSAAINPLSLSTFAQIDIIIMTIVSILAFGFAFTKRAVNRTEGVILTLSYVLYTAYIIVR